ncbi:MAG: hypothetical protein D6705_10055 [Deltaproteobacteria bacterium]|nr:MAG: hypothetical protein D6705_10055 [Deltaproteobacteria bacterium]
MSDDIRPGLLGALFGSVWRDIREMLRNPLAFFGGVVGTVVTGAALVFALMAQAQAADADDDLEELEIDFVPGALVKLGQKPPEEEIPEKIITQETRAEEAAVEESVTEDATPPPEDPPKKREKKKNKLPTPPQKKDSKLPTAKNPTQKNTPYDDLPTVDYNIGDPFGDPNGWAKMKKDGDPWATAVMAALNNNVSAASYGAQATKGDFRFQIAVGKDGKVCKVLRKGGSLPPQIQNLIENDLRRLKLPRPPPDVIKKMRSNCAKIRYTFRWTGAGGVR